LIKQRQKKIFALNIVFNYFNEIVFMGSLSSKSVSLQLHENVISSERLAHTLIINEELP
jgi:hypothetical protein